MDKDEMKNRISLALKDPILQQGFEIICKENTELKKELVEKGQHLDLTEREWGKDLTRMYHFKTLYTKQSEQLTKAKELLKEFVQHYKAKTIYVENMQDLLEQSEQFLSEVEK